MHLVLVPSCHLTTYACSQLFANTMTLCIVDGRFTLLLWSFEKKLWQKHWALSWFHHGVLWLITLRLRSWVELWLLSTIFFSLWCCKQSSLIIVFECKLFPEFLLRQWCQNCVFGAFIFNRLLQLSLTNVAFYFLGTLPHKLFMKLLLVFLRLRETQRSSLWHVQLF